MRKMRMRRALTLLSMLSLCGAQKWRKETSELDHKDTGYNTDTKSCSNLTQVLDNWKYAIMTQVKDLLVHDPTSVLPEYGRIQPLSDAVRDLYKQFNSLKDELGTLSNKFNRVEAFVDDLQAGKLPPPPVWTAPRRPIRKVSSSPRLPLRAPLGAQMRAPDRGMSTGQRSTRTRGRRVPKP